MKLIKFQQFESIHDALNKDELSPMEIRESGVFNVEPEIAGSIAERLNKKDYADLLNEGIFDKLKNFLEKGLPGTTIRKADKILADYKKEKLHTLEEIGTERTKIFKMKTKSDAEPDNSLVRSQYKEVYERGQKVISTIENAEKAKLTAIEQQLSILTKGAKKDRVKTYIDMQLAKLKEEVAKAEILDAKAYTSDEQMSKLQEIVDMRQKLMNLFAKKAQMQAELDSKGGKQELKRPQPGEVYQYSPPKPDKNGEERKPFTVTISKITKYQGKDLPSDNVMVTTGEGDKNNPYPVLIKRLSGFENFDEDKVKTASSNASIDKLVQEISKLESEIESVKVWDAAKPNTDAAKPPLPAAKPGKKTETEEI